MGIAGWRIAFHLVGIVSVVVGITVQPFAIDPHIADVAEKAKSEKSRMPFWSELKEVISGANL